MPYEGDFYSDDFSLPSTGDPEADREIAEAVLDGDVKKGVQVAAAAGATAACVASGVGAAAAPLCAAAGGLIGGFAVDAFNSIFGSDPPPEPSLARCEPGAPEKNLVPPSDWGARIATDAVNLTRFANQLGLVTAFPLDVQIWALDALRRAVPMNQRAGLWTSFPPDIKPFPYYVSPLAIRNMCYLQEEPNSPDARWERQYRAAVASVAALFSAKAAKRAATIQLQGNNTMALPSLSGDLRLVSETRSESIHRLQRGKYAQKTLGEIEEIWNNFVRQYPGEVWGDKVEAFVEDKLVPRGFAGDRATLKSSVESWANAAAAPSMGGNKAMIPFSSDSPRPGPANPPPTPGPTGDDIIFETTAATTSELGVMGIMISPNGIEQGRWYPGQGGQPGIVISPAGIEQNAWYRQQ